MEDRDKKDEKKIKNEIEYIKYSQDLDKFDYNLNWNSHLTFIAVITALCIGLISIGIATKYSPLVFISTISWFIAILGRFTYIKNKYLEPIYKEFNAKKDLLRD